MAEQKADPDKVKTAKKSMRTHVEAMLAISKCRHPLLSITTTTSGNGDEGLKNAFRFRLCTGLRAPAFCRGVGPFRRVAPGGDPEDIYPTDVKAG